MPFTPIPLDVLLADRDRFLGFLAARLPDRATAEDVLQAAYLKSLERGESLRDDESVVAWFYRLLRNAVTDHFRRAGARDRTVDRYGREPGPGAPLDEQTACACVLSVLPTLKPEYAAVVEQVDVLSRPVDEVAREVGITANNASVRLHRARRALGERLRAVCGACATHGCRDCTCHPLRTDNPREREV